MQCVTLLGQSLMPQVLDSQVAEIQNRIAALSMPVTGAKH